MSGEKRAAAESFGSSQLVKRQRSGAELNGNALTKSNGGALIQGGHGAAGLPASVMELSGHSGEVYTARFNPTGVHVASAGMDRNILLWNTTGECANYGMMTGHKSAILDLQWSRDSQVVYTASADKHVASWQVETGERIRRHVGHEEIINCLDVSKRGEEFLVSGSDDGSISIWDPRSKAAIDYIETSFPVTAVCLAEAGNELFSGSIDNEIKAWDLRMKKVSYSLTGHTDTITSLAISPDSQSLLSNSHDSTVRTWDIRPFAPTDRAIKVFDGAQVGLEKNLIRASFDAEGARIAAGGGDGSATIWETKSGKMLHKLPGHKGTVNDVRISPDGSMVLSASTDRTLLLGELP
ncbi:probable U5 snRNP-specific protein-like factor and related proteins [Ramularia collo-cygni]|uniref:Probable U5 snRNP-specific protein-like factor and related proteins n=1 Tax=Ramularia collo-cygni TaxID=112498 RepID=A0A2D3UYX0_9PEZI|nr:probable U5 snRNP-specific protein-like factor and related proteins [Ramularia collo-cygni]CZT17567.1 probable U5 snRNP-specific protein-like factor and related proteins [Ramularia collo-cygni]